MPRIVQILNRFVIGGPAIITANLVKYLAPEFDSMLMAGGKDDFEATADYLLKKLDIEIVEVEEMKRAINPRLDYAAYKKVKEVIRRFKPDIVHTHAAKSGLIGRLAAHHCKVPAIVHTFHGHVFYGYFGKYKTNAIILAERWLAGISHGIVAISEKQKDDLVNVYKICNVDKVKVLPLGLDLNIFQTGQPAKRNNFRSRFSISDDEIAIGLIGRIVPVKNHTLFIEIASKLVTLTSKRIRFIIIGDGEARVNMETLIDELKMSYCYYPDGFKKTDVLCTSWITEIDEALAGLDIIALTSINEGTPVSLIEAQAAAKPLVATNVGGVSDVVVQDKTGYLVSPNNKEEFVNYMRMLIDDPALRDKMGSNGRQFANAHFSMQRFLDESASYYKGLLNQNKTLSK